MISAFISYSHVDRTAANYIAAELRNRGVDVFVDYQILTAGSFMEQLGNEIERRDYFLVIVSPRSVDSEWVQAEIMWALANKETNKIIPIWLEPASLTKVFPLATLQRVDFTRWYTDGVMTEAILALSRFMQLSETPIKHDPVPQPILSKDLVEQQKDYKTDTREVQAIPPPKFEKADIQRMIESATAMQTTDPDQAEFMYQRIVELDPNFMGDETQEFLERQRKSMTPVRLQQLTSRCETAKGKGNWRELLQLSNDMIAIDPGNSYALSQAEIAEKNVSCEMEYERAIIARENQSAAAVRVLMRDIQNRCPEYGDPAGILENQSVTKEFLGFLRNSHTFEGHQGPINCIAFSPGGNILASGSTDNSIKLWSTITGELLTSLHEHSDWVNSLAFSPDNKYLASVGEDKRINLWRVDRWTLEKSMTLKFLPSLVEIEFSPGSNALATVSDGQYWQIHSIPKLDPVHQGLIREGKASSIAFSSDGSRLFVSTINQIANKRALQIWRTSDWEQIAEDRFLNIPIVAISKLCASLDGRFIAAIGQGLHVWTLPRGRRHYDKSYVAEGFTDIVFSTVDSTFLLAAQDDNLTFFDLDAKKRTRVIQGHDDTINSVAMSNDGRFIATGSDDSTAKIWQL